MYESNRIITFACHSNSQSLRERHYYPPFDGLKGNLLKYTKYIYNII